MAGRRARTETDAFWTRVTFGDTRMSRILTEPQRAQRTQSEDRLKATRRAGGPDGICIGTNGEH
jgi:hypothetical protein